MLLPKEIIPFVSTYENHMSVYSVLNTSMVNKAHTCRHTMYIKFRCVLFV